MARKMVTLLALLQFVVLAQAQPAPAADVRWDHRKGEQLSLILDGKPLWTYHYSAKDVPYFHPVSLPGGPTLTALAPKDHPWHRALWFCWKYLNHVNYWEWAQIRKPGTKGIDPHGVPAGWTRVTGNEEVQTGPEGARIAMAIHYGTTRTLVLKEQRSINVSMPRPDGSYTIDWHMTFTAQGQDVVIDRTPPGPVSGGYAGLSYRAPDSVTQVQVLDSEGNKGMAARGPKSRWVDASAVIDPQYGPSGLTILCHPGNERFPSQWHLWAREGGLYTNPSMVYGEPFKLPAGKSFTLSYRVWVHKGVGDPSAIEREFEAYKKTR